MKELLMEYYAGIIVRALLLGFLFGAFIIGLLYLRHGNPRADIVSYLEKPDLEPSSPPTGYTNIPGYVIKYNGNALLVYTIHNYMSQHIGISSNVIKIETK